jgi:HTH-type transcriptional regulator/antitoxin HigA
MRSTTNSANKIANTQLIVFNPAPMPTLTYTVIKTKTQYKQYCKRLDTLLDTHSKNKSANDEIDLLTLLIEKWDETHGSWRESDPVTLLTSLMNDHHMRAKELSDLLEVSKGYVSDILHYKKGLSKDIVRKLAEHFKVSQEAFNRPYKLTTSNPSRSANVRISQHRQTGRV